MVLACRTRHARPCTAAGGAATHRRGSGTDPILSQQQKSTPPCREAQAPYVPLAVDRHERQRRSGHAANGARQRCHAPSPRWHTSSAEACLRVRPIGPSIDRHASFHERGLESRAIRARAIDHGAGTVTELGSVLRFSAGMCPVTLPPDVVVAIGRLAKLSKQTVAWATKMRRRVEYV